VFQEVSRDLTIENTVWGDRHLEKNTKEVTNTKSRPARRWINGTNNKIVVTPAVGTHHQELTWLTPVGANESIFKNKDVIM
jgi:hypothetical protein